MESNQLFPRLVSMDIMHSFDMYIYTTIFRMQISSLNYRPKYINQPSAVEVGLKLKQVKYSHYYFNVWRFLVIREYVVSQYIGWVLETYVLHLEIHVETFHNDVNASTIQQISIILMTVFLNKTLICLTS